LEVTDFVDDVPNFLDDASTATKEELLISLNSTMGIRSEDTMQLCIFISNFELTALLDSGSTHNFISMAAAHRMGLHFHDSRGAHVTVASDDRVSCRGHARDVVMHIGDEFSSVDFYAIPLDYYDMVLGVYLRTLGPILWDCADLCMAFWHHGHRVLWKGISSLCFDIPPTGRLYYVRSDERALLDRLL
jgi:hypothetical protein